MQLVYQFLTHIKKEEEQFWLWCLMVFTLTLSKIGADFYEEVGGSNEQLVRVPIESRVGKS